MQTGCLAILGVLYIRLMELTGSGVPLMVHPHLCERVVSELT